MLGHNERDERLKKAVKALTIIAAGAGAVELYRNRTYYAATYGRSFKIGWWHKSDSSKDRMVSGEVGEDGMPTIDQDNPALKTVDSLERLVGRLASKQKSE